MTTIKQEKTLLDEFAMAALSGILTNQEIIIAITKAGPEEDFLNNLSKFTYEAAMSMMKEKQKYETKQIN